MAPLSNNCPDSVICLRPFYSLELHIRGDVSVCCPAWSKGMIGNTRKKGLLDIWNDEPLQYARRMMLKGRWEKICRPSCPVIMNFLNTNETVSLQSCLSHVITGDIVAAVQSRQTVLSSKPTWINLSNSTTCNLNCVMCGKEYHSESEDSVSRTMAAVKSFLPEVKELFLTGNGDPFARPDTRDFLLNLDGTGYPDLKINLLTNGLLLPKYWDRISRLNFGFVDISVDAATSRTYEKIRSGGKWADLILCLETLRKNRDIAPQVTINMTVMRDNYREIPQFVELAAKYGFSVGINKIRGKWGNQNIFTSGDQGILAELRKVILEARQTAEFLRVPFNCTGFSDILAGEPVPWRRLYRQKALDYLTYLYYGIKR